MPKRNPDVAWQIVDDKVVMVELNQKRMFHQLNSVGSFVWNLCDGSNSIEQITASVTDEFEVTQEQASRDVQVFVDQLFKLGLLL